MGWDLTAVRTPVFLSIRPLFTHFGLGRTDAFEPVHSKAAQYNLRTIAVQRKDYTGSSDYTDAELVDLHDGNKAHLDRLTVLLGHLIQHLIQAHNIPEPNRERTEGGIVIIGWSIGSATILTLLANSHLLGQERYDLLRRYLVKLVFYGEHPLSMRPPFIS